MRRFLIPLIGIAVALTPLSIAGRAEAAVSYSVTLSVSATTINHGSYVTLSGKVSPSAGGQKVLVQRRVGSATTWTTFATRQLTSTSAYSLRVRPGPGPVRYRVVKPRSNGRTTGVSPVRILAVMRWRWLTDRTPTSANLATFGTFHAGVANNNAEFETTFNTVTHAVALGTSGSVEWDIAAWRCTRYKILQGVRDTSPPETVFQTTTYAYRATTGYGFFETGMGLYQSLRLAQRELGNYGILANDRLRMEAYRNDAGVASVNAQVVVAPQLYCNS